MHPALSLLGFAPLALGTGSDWFGVQEASLTSDDLAAEDALGGAVAIDGDRALVGATGQDEAGSVSGAAYVFERAGGGWSQTAKLLASDAGGGDHFGSAVDLDGGRAIVGAREKFIGGEQPGAAYVFSGGPGGWTQEARLLASDRASGDNFGAAVAIGGDVALIGAPLADVGLAGSAGAVYVFERSGASWSEVAKLTASDAEPSDEFGRSVVLDGDRIAVGAMGEDQMANSAGAVYVFERSSGSWSEVAKLTASDGQASDQFGIDVALDRGRLLIGAWGDDDGGNNAGAAYLFEGSGSSWSEQAKLEASDAAAVDLFGISVDIEGDNAVVGAVGNAGGASDAGAAYVFHPGGAGWVQAARLSAHDGQDGDAFGTVAVSGNSVLVGAHGSDVGGNGSGEAYVLRVRRELGTRYCPAPVNSTGRVARVTLEGSPLAEHQDLVLRVEACPGGVPGLFFFGPQRVQIPFGDGLRCVGGGSIRRVPPVAVTGPAGRASRALAFGAPYGSDLVAGATTHVQFWYRDVPGGPAGFTLSDAIEAQLQ